MKILFMCVANSARSQLAEGIAKQVLGDTYDIRSAGSLPKIVNPYAIRALGEVGFDCRDLYSKNVSDLPESFVNNIDYVITLCAEEVCPIIISKAKKSPSRPKLNLSLKEKKSNESCLSQSVSQSVLAVLNRIRSNRVGFEMVIGAMQTKAAD